VLLVCPQGSLLDVLLVCPQGSLLDVLLVTTVYHIDILFSFSQVAID